MRNNALAFVLCAASMAAPAAHADTFNFTAAALGAQLAGTLTATSNNNGSYLVTGIAGTGITGLIAAGDPFFGNDNLLFPTNTRSLDVNGLAFTLNTGGQTYSVDLYSEVSGFQVLALDSAGNLTYDVASFAVSNAAAATPEPSSLLMLGTGLLAVAGAYRRRLA